MKRVIAIVIGLLLAAGILCMLVYGHLLDGFEFVGTAWSILPPIAAIILALITKEVYSSLFLGIVAGALLLSKFNTIDTLEAVFTKGIIPSLSSTGNIGILTFLVTLGILVVLLGRSGGTAAYGRWAVKHIKSRRAAMLSTFALGVVLSVDDYFNTLTVGNVMRPVTDRNKISRAKLSYIIDATAAPMCMIMPISSWAAAVSGNVEGVNGVELFLKAIPFNFYSLLTLGMVVILSVLQFDYGPMRVHERNAIKGDLFTVAEVKFEDDAEADNGRGRVIDLIFPVAMLIITCVSYMLYTGGFFGGTDLITAFANCDASLGLCMGALVTLGFSAIYYYARGLMSFKDIMDSIATGFKSMVLALLILIFAWSLSEITVLLGVNEYVAGIFAGGAGKLSFLLPAIVFIVSVCLAFATGTSWGTMGILLPIVSGIGLEEQMMVISVSACLAGAVCGDHCSPISDTNIMSSTAARCDHIAHVSTQLPYAMVVLAISALVYVLAGITESAAICLPVAFAALAGVILTASAISKKKQRDTDEA